MAGRKFKTQILSTVADWTGVTPDELTLAGDAVHTQWSQYQSDEMVMTLAEIAEKAAKQDLVLTAEAVYAAPKTWPLSDQEARRTVPREEYRNYPTYAYATQVAMVEVEEATGRVSLLNMIAAHDVGIPINPQQIRGQLIGSISMGQGWAPTENYPAVDGRSPWKRLDYRNLGVPTSENATKVRVEIVEDPYEEGPYGAKGISEIATVPCTPAILNAIHDATGVRVRTIPVDPARLKQRWTAPPTASDLGAERPDAFLGHHPERARSRSMPSPSGANQRESYTAPVVSTPGASVRKLPSFGGPSAAEETPINPFQVVEASVPDHQLSAPGTEGDLYPGPEMIG